MPKTHNTEIDPIPLRMTNPDPDARINFDDPKNHDNSRLNIDYTKLSSDLAKAAILKIPQLRQLRDDLSSIQLTVAHAEGKGFEGKAFTKLSYWIDLLDDKLRMVKED